MFKSIFYGEGEGTPMSITNQQKNEAFSIATLLYTRLRRVISRVIDVMYLIENKDYAKYILGLAEQTGDVELQKYVERLNTLLELNPPPVELVAPITEQLQEDLSEPTEDEIYRAQVSHHYIGALR